MKDVKVTKKMTLAAMLTILEGESDLASVEATVNDEVVNVPVEDMVEIIRGMIEQLDKKAEKAAERAKENREKGDEIRNAIEAVLTDDFQLIADIIEKTGIEDLTPAKVSSRLAQLVKAGKAHKAKVKVEDGRTLTGYAAGPAPEAE